MRGGDGTIQSFFASQMDVTDRVEVQNRIAKQKAAVGREVKARTADLEAALEAKTLLLNEVDHRVKNNLTMIRSLLRMQTRTISDPAIVQKLNTMLERADALATVHRRLYQSEDITRFDLGAVAGNLVSDVIGASGRSGIIVRSEIRRIDVPSDIAAPLGLVINELVTNAVKHAYSDGRLGVLTVKTKRVGDQAVIVIADDGPGMAPGAQESDGLGRTLIARLSRQPGAKVEFGDGAPGLRVTLTFSTKE